MGENALDGLLFEVHHIHISNLMNSETFLSKLGADPQTLNEMAQVLEVLALDIQSETSSDSRAFYNQLQYYIVQSSFEIRSLLAAVVGPAGTERNYTPLEKYLVLVAHESLEVVPKLAGRLIKAIGEEPEPRYDLAAIKVAYGEFLKTARSTPVDKKALDLVRNAAVAHHLDKEGDLGILAECYVMTRLNFRENVEPWDVMSNIYAVHIERCLARLGRDLVAADPKATPADVVQVGG